MCSRLRVLESVPVRVGTVSLDLTAWDFGLQQLIRRFPSAFESTDQMSL